MDGVVKAIELDADENGGMARQRLFCVAHEHICQRRQSLERKSIRPAGSYCPKNVVAWIFFIYGSTEIAAVLIAVAKSASEPTCLWLFWRRTKVSVLLGRLMLLTDND